MSDEKLFPIMRLRTHSKDIPWSVIAPFEHRAIRNHSQSLERLAQRGGLGHEEALAVLRDVDYRSVPERGVDAVLALEKLVAERTAPPPLDDPKLQELFTAAITGAMGFGYQGTNPPPPGHWLEQFWQNARSNRERAEADARDLVQMRARKDNAYEERNRVVAVLARIFPAGIARTAIEGWSPDWHGCVYIDLPTGQVSWHFHDSQAHLFEGLPPYAQEWDGHTTFRKYDRLAALAFAKCGSKDPRGCWNVRCQLGGVCCREAQAA